MIIIIGLSPSCTLYVDRSCFQGVVNVNHNWIISLLYLVCGQILFSRGVENDNHNWVISLPYLVCGQILFSRGSKR